MPFAVEMYFDAAAEARVRELWQAVADGGLDSTMLDVGARPHISLAVLDEVQVEPLCTGIAKFAPNLTLSSRFASVGSFPGSEGVVFMAPVVTSELLALHGEFHDRLAGLVLKSHPYCKPGRWVPHCTVGQGLAGDDLQAAAEICRRGEAMVPFRVEEIGLIEYRPVSTLCAHRVGRST